MTEPDYLLSIGVMTGNSLDAADIVLTRFGRDGSIEDLDALSVPMPAQLAECIRFFKSALVDSSGDISAAMASYERGAQNKKWDCLTLDKLIHEYTLFVAGGINDLAKRSFAKLGGENRIDLVGFHGQTCAHQPPSIAKNTDAAYTLQIGDGQLLANETGITVVFDFRSDDLMNGGEGAPLAPVHHEHLAHHLKNRGKFPIAFCNAGNTGNISVITEDEGRSVSVLGWDIGPFNNYPDKLMQAERGEACDFGGTFGARGRVSPKLLRLLFDKGVVTADGANYLLQPPPKSSDPQWYHLLPELCGEAPVDEGSLLFEDRLRTAEYFAAYAYYYSLKWIPDKIKMPACFALCGGGWNNPVSRYHFENLLKGDFESAPILSDHKELFAQIFHRMNDASRGSLEVAMSDEFGFSGQYMEARIFADAAVCRISGQPFSRPETTGCCMPTVLGIVRFPNDRQDLASENLKRWLAKYYSATLTLDARQIFDGRWSRATRGWDGRGSLAASYQAS